MNIGIVILGGVVGAAYGWWLKHIGHGFETPEYWVGILFAAAFVVIGAFSAGAFK